MKKIAALILLNLLFSVSHAQMTDEKAIAEVVARLFKGMELGDSTMVRSVFAPTATGASIFKDKSGQVVLRRETNLNQFVKTVGSPHDQTWFEEIWNLKVQTDGDFAQAWCDYAFYAGNTFSHCGVDAMQFYRTNGEWKIFHMADTRRKTPCDVPKPIQDKHK